MPPLRAWKADCGLDYDWTQIVVASGAKHNVYVALAALLNPGDEVIVPAPYWVSYCEMVSMLGGVPVPVLAEEAQHFKITPAQLEAAVTAKTKAVMLNNPSNPTGMFYTKPELEALAEVCLRHDLYVIADEIYYKLLYDGLEFTSFASLGDEIKERTILINGVSKSYAMTGWAHRLRRGEQRARQGHVQLPQPQHRRTLHGQPVGRRRGAERSAGDDRGHAQGV